MTGPAGNIVGRQVTERPAIGGNTEAQALLVSLPAELLMAYEVSPKVNSPAYNTPDVLQPVA